MVVVRQRATELLLGWAVTLGRKEAPLPRLSLQGRNLPTLEARIGNRVCLLTINPQREKFVRDGKFYDATLLCQEQIGEPTVTEPLPR
jgi:hypothetical protein